jgi:hypothetical protein
MRKNNICMNCGEEKEEVDLDNLVDFCDDCNKESEEKKTQVPEKEKSLVKDAVVYAIETLPDKDRARLAGPKNSEQWRQVVEEIAESLFDILRGVTS